MFIVGIVKLYTYENFYLNLWLRFKSEILTSETVIRVEI